MKQGWRKERKERERRESEREREREGKNEQFVCMFVCGGERK